VAKLTLNDIESGYASVAAFNANFAAIETALENTLSRDGASPNHMGANLDLNGNRVINSGRATSNNDLMSLGQFLEYANTTDNLTGVIPITWEFTSTGEASYPLPLASTNAIDMYIITSNGLTIPPSSYNINPSTQTLVFGDDVPVADAEIVVRLFGKIPEVSGSGVTINNTKRTTYFPIVGGEVIFNTGSPLEGAATDVYLNGVKLLLTQDYTVGGTSVTLTSPATAGDTLEVSSYSAIVTSTQNVLDAEAAAEAAALSASQAAQSAIDAATAGADAGAIAGGTGITWKIKDANYTCANQEGIFANTVLGSWTLTLPSSPSFGTTITIVDAYGTFLSKPLIISTGGTDAIMGLVEDFYVDVRYAAFQLVYISAYPGWRVL
jgi:hypothetical protein